MSRFRMYPTPEQEVLLLDACGHARYVWNLGLEQRLMWERWRGPTPVLQRRLPSRPDPGTGLGTGLEPELGLEWLGPSVTAPGDDLRRIGPYSFWR